MLPSYYYLDLKWIERGGTVATKREDEDEELAGGGGGGGGGKRREEIKRSVHNKK